MSYKTVQGESFAEYEINRSRFLAYVQNISSEAEAIEFAQRIRKLHYDARHHCSAYILGEKGRLQKADDDGEPSGTAGKPILEILKKNEVKDTMIIVTRYFGGIKLGAGGLIRAYGKAAAMGLAAARLVQKVCYRRVSVEFDYPLLGMIEHNLHLNAYRIDAKEYTDKVRLVLLAEKGKESRLLDDLTNWTASKCKTAELNDTYLEIPLINAIS